MSLAILGSLKPSGSIPISIVQDWSGTTADGSASLTIPLAVSRVVRTTASAAGTNGKYFRIKDGSGNILMNLVVGSDIGAGISAAQFSANIASAIETDYLAAINALSAGLGATAPMVVSGAGTAGMNGTQLKVPDDPNFGIVEYWSANGTDPNLSTIAYIIRRKDGINVQSMGTDVNDAPLYASSDNPTFPSQATWIVGGGGTGDSPAPSVTAPSFDTTFDLGAFANAYVFETDDSALSFADVNDDVYAAIIVEGAGTAAANGRYPYRGQFNGNYYNLEGQPDSVANSCAGFGIIDDWFSITDAVGMELYRSTDNVSFIWQCTTWTEVNGDSPAPTVTVAPAGRDAMQTGNAVVAACGVFDDGELSAPQMSGGGAETLNGVVSEGGGGTFPFAKIYAQLNLAGGETSITGTTADVGRLNMQILEVAGLADAPPEDTASSSGGSSHASPGTIAPVSAKNLLIATYAATEDMSNATGPMGWTEITPPGGTGGGAVFQRTFILIQSVATPQTPICELDGSQDWTAVAAAYGG